MNYMKSSYPIPFQLEKGGLRRIRRLRRTLHPARPRIRKYLLTLLTLFAHFFRETHKPPSGILETKSIPWALETTMGFIALSYIFQSFLLNAAAKTG
jgi:hypothetical protein